MARHSNLLVVVLSLSLLLQQFAPAYMRISPAKTSKQSKTSLYKDNDNNKDENHGDVAVKKEESAQRRGVGRTVAKLAKKFFARGLKGIEFTAKYGEKIVAVAQLTLNVAKAIAGCVGLYPDIEKNWKEYQPLHEKFRQLDEQIDNMTRKALDTQTYTNYSFEEFQRTRIKLEDIADEKDRVFRSMGPEVQIALGTESDKVEKEIKKQKAAQQEVDLSEIDRGFLEGMEGFLKSLYPTMVLAVPGVKLIWDRVKDTVVGRALAKIPAAANLLISKAGAAVQNRIMGTELGSRAFKNIQSGLTTSTGSRFQKAKDLFEKAKPGLKTAFRLGTTALGVWSIVDEVKECEKLLKDSFESLKNIKEAIQKAEEILKQVTEAAEAIQAAFDEVHSNSWGEAVISAAEGVKAMMSDESIAKQTDESTKMIISDIQAYIDAKTLDITTADNKKTLSDRQISFNAALDIVPATLSCHAARGKIFSMIKETCGKGQSSFKAVYKSAQGIFDDESERCKNKVTGDLFVTIDQMQDAWNKWVAMNKTKKIEPICLMNSRFKILGIKDLVEKGITDPQKIVDETWELSADDLDEVKAIVDKLTKDKSSDTNNVVKDAESLPSAGEKKDSNGKATEDTDNADDEE